MPAVAAGQDLVVIGSLSVVRALQAAGRREYRLFTFPSFAGAGDTLFDHPVPLDLVSLSAATS